MGKDCIVDSFENSVGWVFLCYCINLDWMVRVGWFCFDLFMLLEYFDVGFVYLWVWFFFEFYMLGIFDSYDGVDLIWFILVGEGILCIKIFVGSSKINVFL